MSHLVDDLAEEILALSVEERASFYSLCVERRAELSPTLLRAIHQLCSPDAPSPDAIRRTRSGQRPNDSETR